jgi:tripartite-type tricarboxylate transporter receptor subunit TctC
MVIPYPPGGPSDVSTRIVVEHAARSLGQPVVFDNKAGASGMIGAEFVKNQPIDDHTFLTTTTAMVCITRHLQAIPFDPEKDFVTVSRMTTSWGVFALHPSVPARTVAEFVAYAKANPGKLNYASSNATGVIGGATVSRLAGIQLTHVPYKSAPQAMQDLLRGEISMMFVDFATGLPHVRSGAIRALTVTTAARSALLVDVPSMKEVGLPEFDMNSWNAIFAPAGTPRPIIVRLNKELREIVADPVIYGRLKQIGFDAFTSTPEELGEFVRVELDKWGRWIKEAGIQPE